MQLTEFGNAKAWPIYLMLGNLSKYIQSDVSSGAMHHLAYIPSLPESFKAFASGLYSGSWRNQESKVVAHCWRELMHAAWCLILDDKFLHAYQYGIVVTCIDGVERRVYPRIFSYSADYPEKALLANIRDKGLYPCPRCLVHCSELHNLGLRRDKKTRMEKIQTFLFDKVSTARDAIYRLGHTLRGPAIERLLNGISAVATINAFVDRLGKDFNPSTMLTVDLLHEIKLGTWKTFFSHTIRILYALSDRLVTDLNERFCQVPMFGNSGTGIRQFPPNVSKMKKMAACDFKDLLQVRDCVGDKTLDLLAELTTELGHLLRHFCKTTASNADLSQDTQANHSTCEQTQKPLNLSTIKFHFMGDYGEHIRRFGTTDSYLTQLGEQSHCAVKRLYGMTNKKNATCQIGAKYLQQQFFRAKENQERYEAQQPEHLKKHHVISHNTDEPINIFEFVRDNPTDPAKKGFITKLKDHILGHLMNWNFDGDMHDEFSSADRNNLHIRNNCIFCHHTMHVNYTTYNVRRDYNTIKPCNRAFCMVASPDTATDPNAHPFWYVAVMGVFHAEVQHTGARSRDFTWKTVEFLWVQWLGIEPDYPYGCQLAKLPKFGFVPDTDDYAFSFLNPAEVIREAQPEGEEDDWMNYYVNIFVDRDMYLRYIGLGVGHQAGTTARPGTDNMDAHEYMEGEDGNGMAFSDDEDEEMIGTEGSHEPEDDKISSDVELEDGDELEEEEYSEGFSEDSDSLEYDDL
ncbi:hypothetical protein NP233_g11062 [Leucocoprinus birnbaumii]|uniref:Uncharacterized protein n=1 Tax=Leucocoprinus birnbaumii TaxID=56174 RepID=A0AAD5VHJ9_9AGAR|nr:hypothetical protein NP233_g11062 [Leucocoprinus birnbaumii]